MCPLSSPLSIPTLLNSSMPARSASMPPHRLAGFIARRFAASMPRPVVEATASAAACTSADHAALVEQPVTLAISLSPAALHDIDEGVREYLSKYILKYVELSQQTGGDAPSASAVTEGGVVLCYHSLKLRSSLGVIRNDSPHIHVKVSLRLILFAPRKGNRLVGVVTRLGQDHVALLVHGQFNASIRLGDLAPEVRRGAELALGAEIAFVVSKCVVADGLLSLLGELCEITQASAPSATLALSGSKRATGGGAAAGGAGTQAKSGGSAKKARRSQGGGVGGGGCTPRAVATGA